VGLPSRKSAADEPGVQSDRQALLAGAAAKGVIRDYAGWRVSLKGTRFRIRGATLFNLADMAGTRVGQAVVFDEYEKEDGTVVKVVGEILGKVVDEVEAAPTAADVAAAQVAADEQAVAVRGLKESGGVNTDPAVIAAVAELKARRERVVALQAALVAAEEAAFAGGGDSDDEEQE
jgi:hypothetical protein